MTTTDYLDPLARCHVEPGHEPRPYFVEKARAWLDAHGGKDVPHEALAIWAESVRNRDDAEPHGVIIDVGGALLAETEHVRGGAGACYVRADDLAALGVDRAGGLLGMELGMALHRVAEAVGMNVMHVPTSEVTRGASRRATARGAAVALLQHYTRLRGEYATVETKWREALWAVLDAGGTQDQVARITGLSRGRISQIAAERRA